MQKYPVGEGREGGKGGRETGLKWTEWGLEGPCNCPPSLMSDKSWELAFEKKREIQHWSAASA